MAEGLAVRLPERRKERKMAEYGVVIGLKASELNKLLTQFYGKQGMKDRFFKGSFSVMGADVQWELLKPLQTVLSCPGQEEWDASYNSAGDKAKCTVEEEYIIFEQDQRTEQIPKENIFQIAIPEFSLIQTKGNSILKEMKFFVAETVDAGTNSVNLRLLAFYMENASALDKVLIRLFISHVFQALEKLVSCVKLPSMQQTFFEKTFNFSSPVIFIRNEKLVFAVVESGGDAPGKINVPEDNTFVMLGKEFALKLLKAGINDKLKMEKNIAELLNGTDLPAGISVDGTLKFQGVKEITALTDLLELTAELNYGLDVTITKSIVNCSITKAADAM